MRITIESNSESTGAPGDAASQRVTIQDGGAAPTAGHATAGPPAMAINAGSPVVEMDHPLAARLAPTQGAPTVVHDGGPAPAVSGEPPPRPRSGRRRIRPA